MNDRNQKKSAPENVPYPIRINRYLALMQYASRRQADRFIETGLVSINGRRAVLGDNVNKGDRVEVDKQVKQASEEYVYVACHKPRGVVSHNPTKGEEGILSALSLPKEWKKKTLAPLGRLDKDSEGLMILSDDGRIVNSLLNPESEHEKEYLVHVDKKILLGHLKQMEKGVRIERYRTKPAKTEKTGTCEFHIILREGKKHQIRRMCAALGYQVQSLKRVRIKNIEIQNLKPGEFREILGKEQEEFLKGLLGRF